MPKVLKSSMSGSNKQTFIVDFDDFSSVNPGYDLLLKLREHFPNFKTTLFTVPFSIKYFTKEVPLSKLKMWAKNVMEQSDWLEIAPHGFAHLKGEWLIEDKKRINIQLSAMENLFKQIGMKFVKVFKAPFWEYTKQVEEVLMERGYTLAVDRNRPLIRTPIDVYVWNWSIDEKIPEYHTIKAHGHIHGTNNGLNKCFPNLLKIPENSKFEFISEHLWKNTHQK